MRTRVLVPLNAVTVVLAISLSAPVRAAAQAPGPDYDREAVREAAREASPRSKDEAEGVWKDEVARTIAERTNLVFDPRRPLPANPPRTAWGDPDLQGVWLIATYTPLERPAELADKAFYTEEEAIAAFRYAAETDAGVDPANVHYDWKEFGMDAWQSPVRPNVRTGLIVDPPDGRIPPLTPEAEKRPPAGSTRGGIHAAGVVTLGNLQTRCIIGLGGPPLVRGGNPGSDSAAGAAIVSAEAQIVQTPGYVVVVMQSNNDVRIIPLDGRPHLPENVTSWLGDPRGHWEGETLVVDSTNFLDRTPSENFRGSTEALHLVERFTRVGPDTIRYEYTIDDPTTWTRPWTVESPLPRVEPPMYEWACHEQNYGVINVVTGAQITFTKQGAF